MFLTSHHNETELLLSLQRSDQKAFTEIYNYYWKPLFVVAASKIKNFTEAEEIVQEIFLDLWKRREELRITTCLSSYLAVCVKYKVLNLLAKKNQEIRYTQYAAQAFTENDFSTENWLKFEDLKDKLAKETQKLPEKCRLVFQLSRENGFSQKQIAFHLGISEKTVESHLLKALRTLRTSLGQLLTSFFF